VNAPFILKPLLSHHPLVQKLVFLKLASLLLDKLLEFGGLSTEKERL
jgi:hypothetical protein